MHRSFQKNKFHDHTIRILENRRVGTDLWEIVQKSIATVVRREATENRFFLKQSTFTSISSD